MQNMKALRTGDHISTPGRLGVDHHGIVDLRGGGGVKVLHNAKGVGGIVSPLHEFSGGNPVKVVVKAEPGNRIAVATRAREDIGRPYDILDSNCEHMAYRASVGVEISPQLRSAGASVAVVGGGALVISGLACKEGGGGRIAVGAALLALGLLLR